MLKNKPHRFEALVRLIHNSFANKKNIIIFVGNNGIYLAAIKHSKCIDSLFVSLEDRDNPEVYKYFFKKYKEFYVFLLYDGDTCLLKHEAVPVMQSVVKVSPIEKFIEEHYNSSDITAHHVYNISTKNGEVWDSLIARTPYLPPLSDLLNYLLENSLKFSGIYFLSLEYITIISKVLEKTNNRNLSDHLQIFAYITKANSIRFVVKSKENIISIKSVPYPTNRTELYVQGIIEQEVSDYIINLKNYIQKNNLQVCMIFLVGNSLKTLLEQSKFEPHKVLIVSNNEVSNSQSFSSEDFSDKVIAELFADNKTYLALNNSIKSITQANLVNFLMFKPFMLVIAVLLIMMASIKFQTRENIKKIETLDRQNYLIIEQYRDIKQKYPDIKNVANLADMYSLTALLKVPVITPFDFLENFLENIPDDVNLNKISWKLNNPNNNIFTKDYINITVNFKYIKSDVSAEEALANLNSYIENLKGDFQNFSISYSTLSEPLTILNRIIIPVTLTVLGPEKL